MPWCPRCDEVFPEGPACPRCRAALVEVSGVTQAEDRQTVVLPALRLPRRYRRAFGTRPPPPPRHLLAVALSLVLVAGGFTLGRMSAVPPDGPVMRAPPIVGLRAPADGTVTFLRQGPFANDYALVRTALQTGAAEVAARFTSPFAVSTAGSHSRLVSGLGDSIAVAVSRGGGRGFVKPFPASRPEFGWLDGEEAAWEDEETLLVRDGSHVTRWRFSGTVGATSLDGAFRRLFQTAAGAVLEAEGALYVGRRDGVRKAIDLPSNASTLAVAPSGAPAFVVLEDRAGVWDGARFVVAEFDPAYRARGASFSPDGRRIAVVLQEREAPARSAQQLLAVFDTSGYRPPPLVSLPPAGATPVCALPPAWDATGRWVIVGPGDRSLHAIEVGGIRRSAEVHEIGCGVTWAGDGRDAART